jgi:hypothetical protein
MSSHINSIPSLDLPQANASSDIFPTLQFSHFSVSVRWFIHTNGKTGKGSRKSFLITIVVIVVTVDDARDGEGKNFFELFAHGLGDFADTFRLFAAVATEDGAGEDFGFGQGMARGGSELVE